MADPALNKLLTSSCHTDPNQEKFPRILMRKAIEDNDELIAQVNAFLSPAAKVNEESRTQLHEIGENASDLRLLYLSHLYISNPTIFVSQTAFEAWLLEKSKSPEKDEIFGAIVTEHSLWHLISRLMKTQLAVAEKLIRQQKVIILTVEQENKNLQNQIREIEQVSSRISQ